MADVTAEQVSKLREQTGAGVMECRRALIEADGDIPKAEEILKSSGLSKAEKRSERETSQGVIETYSHAGGKIASMVEINCETDFVARTDEFKSLAQEIAMQVAAMNPENVDALLEQDYIREPSKKIKDLVTEAVAKTGENVRVKRITRFALGE
ncbi:MAG: translation elongation factor Ts [Candidatus Woykebacteria bacterium RIFCSPHIGHO2_12_FULL_43_10]|uniref:Elongation factor Ts n=2 Tax=Candidatus Woykeibacteriota TaxID=1817899 RepID=A0A1G1WVU6_9BACT|nr:MAG: translation elongation factor Ts [Candidatus Woykebacteria bacterium RIFCSPHIGHO2_01_FULL_43_29]OGY28849.1 MAG: translation elongation factor Ts [Candidatus Woykebacteria bacterium RIFCSPHIGHO2_12_FULL_43_10]OGY30209.1 MAG: translation elongation factor Ts [Candidatus Woykebacteria bacterium RIFCSPHIGHO2_02_FULL_43_16b]OGY31872.1 MAG: translation elongation factor Ts [Candidatus Woykebacteria bacterium RIFCSPLOWO2_01_FULL_43_14]